MIHFIRVLLLTTIFTVLISSWALTPEHVVVVANKMAWHSVELAKYYMKVRGIPPDNLIRLRATSDEICSREDYDKDIASPVRTFLEKNDPGGNRFHCLVTMYGVPLKVLSPRLTAEEQKKVLDLQKRLAYIRDQIKKREQQKNNEELKTLKDEEAQVRCVCFRMTARFRLL